MNEPTATAERPEYTFTKPEGLLAHYTTATVVFEHILPTGQLRLSPYRLMRDPVESKDILPSIAWHGDRPEADRAIADVYAHLKAARDRMRVLSVTRDAQQRGKDLGRARSSGGQDARLGALFDCCWSRPRMWEQYGDVHRGACLLFDRPALERAVDDAWPRERTYMRHVDYTREGIAASAARTLIDQRIFEGQELVQAVAEYVEQRHYALFFLKSDDFATEYEYRIVLAAGDDGYAYIDYRDALVGVVLGERFPAWQRPAASATCSSLGLKLGRMHWEHGRPHVLRLSP